MGIKSVCHTIVEAPVKILNDPIVKRGIQKYGSIFACICGPFALYDLVQIAKGRTFSTDITQPKNLPEIGYQAAIIMSKFSMVLGALTARPTMILLSKISASVLHPNKVKTWFGPNATYLMSIATTILALPLMIYFICKAVTWTARKILRIPEEEYNPYGQDPRFLTDAKVRFVTPILFFTTPFVLRQGNIFAHRLLKILS